MLTPEQYNAVRGHAFAVEVMDQLRQFATDGKTCTLWDLRKAIGDKYALGPASRNQLYGRLRNLIRQFENGGLVTTRPQYSAQNQVYTKVITLCSTSSSS